MNNVLFELPIDESHALVIPDVSCAPEIFSLIDEDRDHLRVWLPWVDSTHSVEDTRRNLIDRIESFTKKEQASFYGTFNDKFVASVGFVILDNSEGEIGYWLLSGYQGMGLMTTFVRACIEYGFKELDLDTIIIKCAEGNSKSAAIPKRLGFTLIEKTEATISRGGYEHQTLVFALRRSDWYF